MAARDRRRDSAPASIHEIGVARTGAQVFAFTRGVRLRIAGTVVLGLLQVVARMAGSRSSGWLRS